MSNRLTFAADALTVVVGIVVLSILGAHYFGPSPSAIPVDFQIEESAGIDFSVRPTTLIVALSENCRFCQDSMPFYRTLTAMAAENVQIVVAAPPHEPDIGAYLASEYVRPDDIVFPAVGVLPVTGTPTLMIADSTGLVTHSWVGQLNSDGEGEVLHALFD